MKICILALFDTLFQNLTGSETKNHVLTLLWHDMTWHDMIWPNWLYMLVLPGYKSIKSLLIWHQHGREKQFRYPGTMTCYDMTCLDMTWHDVFIKMVNFYKNVPKTKKKFLNGNSVKVTTNWDVLEPWHTLTWHDMTCYVIFMKTVVFFVNILFHMIFRKNYPWIVMLLHWLMS